jgi:hypothetical protein
MKTETMIIIGIGVIFQVLFLVVLFRNIITRKSIVGWLFPGGTTKIEKLLMVLSMLVVLFIISFGPFSSE